MLHATGVWWQRRQNVQGAGARGGHPQAAVCRQTSHTSQPCSCSAWRTAAAVPAGRARECVGRSQSSRRQPSTPSRSRHDVVLHAHMLGEGVASGEALVAVWPWAGKGLLAGMGSQVREKGEAAGLRLSSAATSCFDLLLSSLAGGFFSSLSTSESGKMCKLDFVKMIWSSSHLGLAPLNRRT